MTLLLPGYRPAPSGGMPYAAIFKMATHGTGTRYVAAALHSSEEGRKKHEEMGFHQGCGKALDQRVEHVKSATTT